MFLCLKKETRSEKQETSFCSYVLMSSKSLLAKTTMKKFYTLFLTTILLAMSASGQTLADLISSGKSGEYYIITEKLLGVYVPMHHRNVIFVKDDNNYAGKSKPTEDQYNSGKLYDERGCVMDANGNWHGTFDQSNWMKLVFPASVDATKYIGKYLPENSVMGIVNLQNQPCNPLGLTMTMSEDDYEWMTEPITANAYDPNTYCTANFVLQREWYLVKPQNQEYALIHWAVYNTADKKFYVPKKNLEKGWNTADLAGSFTIDMSLFENNPGVDPDEVFTNGTAYDFYAMIECRTGSTISLNIDPGFGGENNYHFAPSKPANNNLAQTDEATTANDSVAPRRRATTPNVAIGAPGEPLYLLDDENNRFDYTVIVYPLRLDRPEVITGVAQTVGERSVESVRYSDLQGRLSTTPHPGMNIVVTTYSDGSTTTRKAIW